ncbi:MAG TPA: hypothetical protein DIS76_03255 [Rhodospirillaceae bacterium]|nr:hypothetical protein [Rhodospirillaceae bacterium]
MTGLLLPAGNVMAAVSDTTDPNHPIVAELKKQAEKNDQTGITLPDGRNVKTNFLPTALGEAPVLQPGGCNPVVMAVLRQNGNLAANQEVAMKSELYKSVDLKNSNCLDLGRNEIANDARERANALNDSLLGAIGAALGLSLEVVQNLAQQFGLEPSSMLMAKVNQTLDQQCMNIDKTRGNIFENMNGAFGTQAMSMATSSGAFTVKYNNASGKPPGSGSGNDSGKSAVRLPAAQPRAAAPAPRAAAPVQQQKQEPTTPAAPKRNIYN